MDSLLLNSLRGGGGYQPISWQQMPVTVSCWWPRGEDKTMKGWLLYGAALNAGRKLFPTDDRGFGQWPTSCNLDKVHPGDQQAAMWAAAYPEDLEATMKAHPKVRTVRGLYAKFNQPVTCQRSSS